MMVLVTGCLGYIGKRIVKILLRNGYRVRGLIMENQQEEAQELEKMGMEVFVGDLLCGDSLVGIGEDIDIVFHLAGLHSSINNMVKLYVNGTEALFKALEGYPVKLFVFSSNSSVYGSYRTRDTFIADETMPLIIEHPFAEITKNAEEVVQREANRNCIKYVILRIGEVYGEDKYNLLHKMQHPFSLLGNGKNFVSLIHIDDLLNVLMMSITGLKEGIYNVCDSHPCVQWMLFEYGAKLSKGYGPTWIGTEELEERILQSIHGLKMLSIKMSNDKLCRETGYTFSYPSYREGLNVLLQDEKRGVK